MTITNKDILIDSNTKEIEDLKESLNRLRRQRERRRLLAGKRRVDKNLTCFSMLLTKKQGDALRAYLFARGDTFARLVKRILIHNKIIPIDSE